MFVPASATFLFIYTLDRAGRVGDGICRVGRIKIVHPFLGITDQIVKTQITFPVLETICYGKLSYIQSKIGIVSKVLKIVSPGESATIRIAGSILPFSLCR